MLENGSQSVVTTFGIIFFKRCKGTYRDEFRKKWQMLGRPQYKIWSWSPCCVYTKLYRLTNIEFDCNKCGETNAIWLQYITCELTRDMCE